MNQSDLNFPEPHWTSTKFSKNMLMDALVKHLLGLVFYGRTDIGEVLEVAGQLKGNDEECWIKTWGIMAQRLQDRAENADRSNKWMTASTAYLRASTYWRASQYMAYWISINAFQEPLLCASCRLECCSCLFVAWTFSLLLVASSGCHHRMSIVYKT